MTNLALNKAATQSSTSQWSRSRIADEDARGANNGQVSDDYAFHTERERGPWWQVDLEGDFYIRRVVIFNWKAYAQRLKYFSILGSLNGRRWKRLFSKIDGTVFGDVNDRPYVVEIEGDQPARFVRVRLDGYDYLHFRECQVFGDPIDAEARKRIIDEEARTEAAESQNWLSDESLAPTGDTAKKYNLGCGNNYLYGWVNVDQFADVKPDFVMDLEMVPWPIESDLADEVLLNHVLEHLGGNSGTFLNVVKELYRICRPDAKIVIRVPDPRHDDFFGDPTHQRPILPALFQTFDLASNEDWVSRGLPGTPLGKYLRVDFATTSVRQFLDSYWTHKCDVEKLPQRELRFAQRSLNNTVQVSEVVLTARKPFSPGRSLHRFDAIVIQRWYGLGDALMALSAARAIKAATGLPVMFYTAPENAALARLTPAVDTASDNMAEIEARLSRLDLSSPLVVDWHATSFGTSRFHQVDAFLLSLGLTLPDADKGVELVLPKNDEYNSVYNEIDRTAAGRTKIVIYPSTTDPNRTWPPEFWLELTRRLLDEGHAIIIMGWTSNDGRSVAALSNPGVINLIDRLDLVGTIGLLRRADILISNDSDPIQLAGASDIAIIGLYSVVEGANRLPYRHGSPSYKAVAVAPSCPFHPCYRGINDFMTVAAFCATSGIPAGDRTGLFSQWCLNPDRFGCTRDPSVLDKVLAAVRRFVADEAIGTQKFD